MWLNNKMLVGGGFDKTILLILKEARERSQIWSLQDLWKNILEDNGGNIFLSAKQKQNGIAVVNNEHARMIRNF